MLWGTAVTDWLGTQMIVKLLLLTAIYCALILLPRLVSRAAVPEAERA